jgi:prepilin-type N-terminal cleavage/methylation domain-containing protein
MKRKGFTLIELLVVIAIIALLMGILMPALARVRALAHRVVCGSNLRGIGTSIQVYANENNQKYPLIPSGTWNGNICTTHTGGPGGGPDGGSITSAFYELIIGGYSTPGQFVCKSDSTVTPLELEDWGTAIMSFEDGFDFGDGTNGDPRDFCSYAYHCPIPGWALGPSSNPRMALAADWNPFLGGDTGNFTSITNINTAIPEDKRAGNCEAHQKEGQNVLFNDNSVEFADETWCALDDDNVYRAWVSSSPSTTEDRAIGVNASQPANRQRDSLLVNDQ